ncbi:MAG: lysylphosphatidylglycerol synthase transmembrane domain-containing protein [Anaerolineae bacterium]
MRKWNLVIAVAISLICLILALAGIEWHRAGEALRRADWRYLIPAGAALLGYLLARAIRWRVLLGPGVGLGDSFAVTNIGYLISNVLPFRLGDPARAVAIGLDGKVKISAALSTVVVERVLDMLTIVSLLAVTIPFVGEAGWTRKAGLLGGLAGMVTMGLLVSLAVRPVWGMQVLDWILGRLPWMDRERWIRVLDGLLEGLTALRSMQSAATLLAWSIITWVFTVGHYFAILRAFVDDPSVVEASFLTCATGLGMALPSSPGALGVFHSVARYALQLPFGVPVETAVVVAFASHTFQYVVMCLLGLIGLVQRNLSLRQLRSDAVATMAAKE